MNNPMKWTWGWNNNIIFTIIKKMPTTTKQKSRIARVKKNLNIPSIYF